MRSATMSEALMGIFGDSPEAAQRDKRCIKAPMGCGKPIDQTPSFREQLHVNEYKLSGLCQDCQDAVFNMPLYD